MYNWKVCPIQGRQLRDVRDEDIFGDFRICNTYRGGGGYDQFPKIAEKRGLTCNGDIGTQFVVQLYGCTLKCPYCYVTADGIWGYHTPYTSDQLAGSYISALVSRNAGVFHLMGGAPAVYYEHWPELLDKISLDNTIFHSDLMLVEKEYKLATLRDCNRRNTLYAVNIKGADKEDYFRNTRCKFNEDLFWNNFDTVVESGVNFYMTFTNPDMDSLFTFKETVARKYGEAVLDDHFVIDIVDYEALR